jgi:DNA topoisomerase-1
VLARVERLCVPPGWRDVHVARSARSAVQAWGVDAKGRKQYRYHERAQKRGELRKYYRVRRLALDLPRIRHEVRLHMRERGLTKRRVAAAVVRLISEGFARVGGERYTKENRTYGVTTLRKAHVTVDGGCVFLSYRGKSGVEQRQVVVDGELAQFVATLERTPGPRLFRYRSADGGWCDLTARDVNDYLRTLVGVPYTAKDFRTWGGTLRMATVLADLAGREPPASERERRRDVTTALRLVAAELGNTPMICRKSYVHPMVIARYLDEGETIAEYMRPAAHRTGGFAHAPEERALIKFLERHFPERRRRPREKREERRAA